MSERNRDRIGVLLICALCLSWCVGLYHVGAATFKQGAAGEVKIYAVSSTDGKTPVTVVTWNSAAVLKAGVTTWDTLSGSPVSNGYGWHTFTWDTAMNPMSNLGDVVLHFSGTGIDPIERRDEVRTADLTDIDTETDAIQVLAAQTLPTVLDLQASAAKTFSTAEYTRAAVDALTSTASSVKATTDKLEYMSTTNGSGGYRYTADALVNVPAAGGAVTVGSISAAALQDMKDGGFIHGARLYENGWGVYTSFDRLMRSLFDASLSGLRSASGWLITNTFNATFTPTATPWTEQNVSIHLHAYLYGFTPDLYDSGTLERIRGRVNLGNVETTDFGATWTYVPPDQTPEDLWPLGGNWTIDTALPPGAMFNVVLPQNQFEGGVLTIVTPTGSAYGAETVTINLPPQNFGIPGVEPHPAWAGNDLFFRIDGQPVQMHGGSIGEASSNGGAPTVDEIVDEMQYRINTEHGGGLYTK